MHKIKEMMIIFSVFLMIIQSVSAISNVQHFVDGNRVILTYQGAPPFLIKIRPDTNIGQNGGYLWAKTYSNDFSYDLNFAINPSKTFYYGIKDTSWSNTNNFHLGEVQKPSLYIVKDTDSLLRASSFIKKEVNTPLIFYLPGREEEIINFIHSFKSVIAVTLVYSTDNNFVNLENKLSNNQIQFSKKSIDSLTTGNYNLISFSDEEELKPYAAVFAGKNQGLFLDSLVDLSKYINNAPSGKIVYFGNTQNTLSQIHSLSSNIEHIPTLHDSEIKLAPTNSDDKIVTVIPKIPSQYSRLGVLYAIYRDTALISVFGQEDDAFSFDYDINAQLNLIKTYNNNQEYGYMVIVGNWSEIPYNYEMPSYIFDFNGGSFPFRFSSDMMYADRNSYWSTNDIGDNDKTFVPDMGVGRILGYDLTSASILLNMGYLYENDLLIKSNSAIYSSDWRIDGTGFRGEIPLKIIQNLVGMYGQENMYAEGDPDDTNLHDNNPQRDKILSLTKDREFILLEGHGAPNYLSATNPEVQGLAILEKRPYKPAFWYLSACTTIGYCDYCDYTNLDGALRSLSTNVYGTVAIWGTGSGWESWYLPYFEQGYPIGDVIRLGLQDAAVEFERGSTGGTINGNSPSQFQIIGDPLLSYGKIERNAPKMAMKASAIFEETTINKKIMFLSNNMLNFVYPPFESYSTKFEGNCGKMIIIDNKDGLQKISKISLVNYNEIKNLVKSVSGIKIDITQDKVAFSNKDVMILPEYSCKLIFTKK